MKYYPRSIEAVRIAVRRGWKGRICGTNWWFEVQKSGGMNGEFSRAAGWMDVRGFRKRRKVGSIT